MRNRRRHALHSRFRGQASNICKGRVDGARRDELPDVLNTSQALETSKMLPKLEAHDHGTVSEERTKKAAGIVRRGRLHEQQHHSKRSSVNPSAHEESGQRPLNVEQGLKFKDRQFALRVRTGQRSAREETSKKKIRDSVRESIEFSPGTMLIMLDR